MDCHGWGSGVNSTGIFTGWVLVYRDAEILIAQFQESQETSTIHPLETFSSEEAMRARIAELRLKNPEDEGVLW